ncbi:hypothetical protein V6N13_020836 [Hibiscus sabdariffa]|uniref:Peptidase C1A papain C-terminal domain-containing protein n=1 Tax=Hibiscus sabdariffa TaxID=183260 RepID=A0ABR2EXS6_9ROSI
MTSAFKYIIRNQGISRKESYPYETEQGTYHMEKQMNKAITITSYERVPEKEKNYYLRWSQINWFLMELMGLDGTLSFFKVVGCLSESVEMIKTMRLPLLDMGGVKKVWTNGSSRIHEEKVGVKWVYENPEGC